MTTEIICEEWINTLEQGTPENIDDINGVNEFKKIYCFNPKNDPNWKEKLKVWIKTLEQETTEFKKPYIEKYYLNRKNDPNWKEKLRELNKLNYAKRKEKKLEENQLKIPIVKEKNEIDPNKKEKLRELNKLNYAKKKAKKLEENQLKIPIVKEKKKITKEEKKIYNNNYINKKKNIIILCECGHEYSFIQKTQHYNTQKHIKGLKKLYCEDVDNKKIDWDNEEEVHLYNCQFGDYDQEIRSFKD